MNIRSLGRSLESGYGTAGCPESPDQWGGEPALVDCLALVLRCGEVAKTTPLHGPRRLHERLLKRGVLQ